ncbi:hypothetical protein [Parasphingorhabdus sp.]
MLNLFQDLHRQSAQSDEVLKRVQDDEGARDTFISRIDATTGLA